MLIDDQVGPFLVLDDQSAGLSGEKLHMILPQVNDMICCGHRLPDGVDPRFQIRNADLTLVVGGSVKVVAAILDFSDAESYARQRRTIRTELDDLQCGLNAVRKNKLSVLVAIELDNTLCLIDDIAGTGFFSHNIRTNRQFGEVDFTILVGGKLLRAVVPGHRFDLKNSVRDDLGWVCVVHLYQMEAGFHIVEVQQFLDAVTGVKFYLLGSGVQNVVIAASIYLIGQIGAGSEVSQQYLAKLICLEFSHGDGILEHLKGHAGHSLHGLAVILDNAQSREFFVRNGHICR